MNAMFLKLLNLSAAGSVLILAVVVLRALLKRAPRWIICVMWALVAIRLICPFSIVSPISAFRAAPSIVSESGEVEVFRLAGGSEKPLVAVDTVQIERPRTSSETIRELPGTSYAVTQRSRDAYLPPLVQAYLLGLTVMLLYTVISTLTLRKRVSASLRQRGNIRVCDELASPFILGIFQPVIYLPSSLSEEEKRFVLAHERAHLRRLDHVWKPLGFLILSVHWFNPLCWLAYVLLCRDIELACDEKVIRELGRTERAAYSQTLLNCSAHRILAACPVAFGETDVKTRVKAVLNYKKPAFWIVLAAVLGCIVLAVCFAAKPMPSEPDLSFLNYKNAIPLIGQNDTAPYANLYPADSDGVQPGVADNKALVQFLESAKWTKRRAPSSSPEPRGYIEFTIEDDYRIILYQSERLAAVRFGNDVRYYRTAAGDYEKALQSFIPAPSTKPDQPPSQSLDYELMLSNSLTLLRSFSDAQVVTVIDKTGRSYENSGKSFDEIVSSQTWSVHQSEGFPASDPDRLIVMIHGDWELRIEEASGECLYMIIPKDSDANSLVTYLDCGLNLLDELMPWATYEAGMPIESGLTVDDEIWIEQMFSELDETNQSSNSTQKSLTRWATHDPDGVVRLCEKIGCYAETHRLSYPQILSLLMVKRDFDGADAEAYSSLLTKLYECYPAQFVFAAKYCVEQFEDNYIRDFLSYEMAEVSLEQEIDLYNTIFENLQFHLSQYQQYINIPDQASDMEIHVCKSALPQNIVWIVDGVSPAYYVNLSWASDALILFFDNAGTLVGQVINDTINSKAESADESIPEAVSEDSSEILTSMLTPTTGYLLKKGFPAAGQMQSTLFYTDDGKAWIQVREIHDDVHNFPKLLYFWNQNDGIILTDYHGYSDCVYRTQDGGITWSPVAIELPPEESAILSRYSYLEGENVEYEAGSLVITLSAHFENQDSRLFTVIIKDGISSEYFDDMGSQLVLSNDNGKTCNVSFGVYKVSWFENALGEYNPDTGVLHFTAQDGNGKSVSAEVRTEDDHLVVTITNWDYEEYLPNGTELVFYKQK